jgi:hypothetical protein
MHFGKVKSGDRYSVSPEATLGPTVQEIRDYEREDDDERKERLRERVWSEQRLREKSVSNEAAVS